MTSRHRILPAALVLIALAATAGCNKRDVPPVNPSSPTAPTVPSPEVSASAPMPAPAASQ